MSVRELWISGHRSVHELRLPLAPVTVVVGPNECGTTKKPMKEKTPRGDWAEWLKRTFDGKRKPRLA